MALQTPLLNAMAEAGGDMAVTASLHTADPGSGGGSEVVGGSYARQAITWGTAAGGTISSSATITFAVPGGTTVTHVGLWSGADEWLGGITLSSPESYGADGTYELTTLSISVDNA